VILGLADTDGRDAETAETEEAGIGIDKLRLDADEVEEQWRRLRDTLSRQRQSDWSGMTRFAIAGASRDVRLILDDNQVGNLLR
jgi:hypothetical protein